MPQPERRSRRSFRTVQALNFLLEAVRGRGGYEAVIVADEHGFLVGASESPNHEPRALAADLHLPKELGARAKVTQVPFRVYDRLLYIGAIGEGLAAPLVDAVYGARRILAA